MELDLRSCELRREGAPVATQKKVLDLLLYLVEHRDRAVSKDDLMNAVWPDTIVTDAVLTSAIRKARKAIDDDDGNASAIKTIHRHGYRFVAPVVVRDSQAITKPEDDEKGPRAQERPAIIVLPFVTLSSDANQEYFADAVASDIITLLAKHRWLNVVARNTAFGYRGRNADLATLRGEQDVNYVVEGTVRKVGERIRVTAELVDAATGRQVWGDMYDHDLADVFAVQDEITRMIVGRLEPEIGTAERHRALASIHPNLRAWECFHLGLAEFYRFTAESNIEAQRLLQRARELDANFGEAHAWWAYATVLGMVYWETDPSDELLDVALAATQQALTIDDQNAVFYALKARVQLARCEYDSALRENEIAIRLNPTLAVAYCGLGDSLAYEGRYEEAVRQFESAIELSPNDPQRWAFLTYGALALLFKTEYDQALAWADRALEVPNCQYWAQAHRMVALISLDRKAEAEQARQQLMALKPEFSIEFATRKLFFLKRSEQREQYLSGLERAGIGADR